jgi:hypothetical protein
MYTRFGPFEQTRIGNSAANSFGNSERAVRKVRGSEQRSFARFSSTNGSDEASSVNRANYSLGSSKRASADLLSIKFAMFGTLHAGEQVCEIVSS